MKKYTLIDGNTAASKMAYQTSDMAIIYPITPSSPMAENIDELASRGETNAWGRKVSVTEMQSEAGAAGALHGALSAGSLATTFTSSQGLLLMVPNMFKIAGENLPCVIHVAARTVATHALSIFGDHSDVMSVRSTGFAMLASSSVQEAQDLALASHLATVEARVPFVHFFDGFRTSHEINKIEEISKEQVKSLINQDAIDAFKFSGLTPENPTQRGTAQNEDVFFQNREACNPLYNAVPEILKKVLSKIAKTTGRKYNLFDYVGAKDAEYVYVAMGSGCEMLEETIEKLTQMGEKVGLVKVRLFRPFSIKDFANCLPQTTKVVSVLDRTKEPGAIGEPLYLDICSALRECGKQNISVLGGRYGLSGKEFSPNMALAILKNMQSKSPKNHFTVGINDDVTNTSLKIPTTNMFEDAQTVECKFIGLGSDGTVGANKNSVKIIGENTPLSAQAFFVYDSKKAGSVTVSHLRFAKKPIKSTYLCKNINFLACHNKSFIYKFNILEGVKKGAVLLLNSPWTEKDIEANLPVYLKNKIAEKELKFYTIDANKIAEEVGLGRKINLVMQACFFKLTGILPWEESKRLMKEFAQKTYAKKGEKVVQMNFDAIDKAETALIEIKYPKTWKTTTTGKALDSYEATDYFTQTILPILMREGDEMPVSSFNPSGEVATGTTKFEKRNIAEHVPTWIPENCIQCNMCSMVCPHACIRPYLLESGSKESKLLNAKPALAIPGKDFAIQVSPADCTGCENCKNVCPARTKALEMKDTETVFEAENKKYNAVKTIINHQSTFLLASIKGSQFKQPLFEFSGACAGCGETPYVKLLTQLFGEKMMVANATGCSSIYGGSSPTCPYTTNEKGKGPAWSNSLFEDNAEFGLGMALSHKNNVKAINELINQLRDIAPKTLVQKLLSWQSTPTEELAEQIEAEVLKEIKNNSPISSELKQLYSMKSALHEKSFWIMGGDGWAYDIGFSGIDHALSSNENINIMVLDTEVYSNTGGQASKSTPMGSTAKFAASGKTTHKKDLAHIAMQYPNVYVAQISMGANMNQTIQAMVEAEKHNGPSIIIAYCPCMNHGIDMTATQQIEKLAVETGYWQLLRYNPQTNVLTLDPPFATKDYHEFLNIQNRYKNLLKINPEGAKQMFEAGKAHAHAKIEKLKTLAGQVKKD